MKLQNKDNCRLTLKNNLCLKQNKAIKTKNEFQPCVSLQTDIPRFVIINKKTRNKIKNIQETNLHNEVLILNRSVPSLRVRLESRTQSYFFPCCFQKKKDCR